MAESANIRREISGGYEAETHVSLESGVPVGVGKRYWTEPRISGLLGPHRDTSYLIL
ncbi:hypothetical protein GRZ55_10880 [Chelativorans sp. ZYF759]|uniref:hypothetical protein n=1 Tax=Chelativorans sp. ZYF759 TaxID=2692213 RepID=UPI00145D0B8E|nr:hypothetical protein [Chelativorans sp. ZYF759]NMG39746.1 hypothetical protein [Chelativorans sp. ZYF759]